jgi:pyridoxine kinase
VAHLLALGPRIVLITSLDVAEVPADRVAMLAATRDGAWLVAAPRLDFKPNGGGDLTAALFLAHYLREKEVALALAKTAGAVHAVLAATLAAGGGELAIIAAQDALLAPPQSFKVERVE